MTAKVAVLVGSLRQGSINRQLAEALAKLAEGRLELGLVDTDLPHFNQDRERDLPSKVRAFRAAVAGADAVLFATPEFNRSFPALIKNAIEWGSRPYGQSIWPGKPAAIVGASPGAIGTAVAQAQLRSVLTAIGMNVLSGPEIYLQHREGLYNRAGEVADEGLRKLLNGWLDAFAEWVERMKI